jgi:hypothetical protein
MSVSRVVFRKLEQLKRMRRRGAVPTIGEINSCYSTDKKDPPPGWSSEAEDDPHAAFKLKCLDDERDRQYRNSFRRRPDYGLFLFVRRDTYTSTTRTTLTAEMKNLWGQMGRHQPPEIVWGWQAVVSLEMLKQFERVSMSSEELVWISTYRRQLLSAAESFDLRTVDLDNAQRHCAFIRLLTRAALCKTRYDLDKERLQLDDADRLARDVMADLLVVFGDVGVGQSLDWRAIHHDRRPVLPLQGQPLFVALVSALLCVRATVRNAFHGLEWNGQIGSLVKTLAIFAECTWRTATGLRIHAIRTSSDDAVITMCYAQEMQLLQRAGQAHRDAGNYLASAVYAHRWLWTLTDELLERNRETGTDLAYFVRQCGFTVDDERFPRDRASNRLYVKGELVDDENHAGGSEAIDPARMRRTWDQTMNPATKQAWEQVLRRFPERPSEPRYNPLGHLVYSVHRDSEDSDALRSDTSLMRAALSLSLEYKAIGDAAKLLRAYPSNAPLNWADLKPFVQAVEDAQRIMPFGIELNTHEQWHETIRAKVAALAPDERQRISADDWLRLHEVLHGRCVTVIRGAKFARAFAQKFYGFLHDREEEIRNLYRFGHVVKESRLASVSINVLQECASRMEGGGLGPPVFVSLLETRANQWSLFVASGRDSPDRLPEMNYDLRRDVKRIQETRRLWEGIPWRPGARALGMTIIKAVAAHSSNSGWLILSVEPSLAGLPWQSLLRDCAREAGRVFRPFVVSIVPSFDWVRLAYDENRSHIEGVKVLLADSGQLLSGSSVQGSSEALAANPLIATRNRIESDIPALRQRFKSILRAYGHGRWGPLEDLLPSDYQGASEMPLLAPTITVASGPIKFVSDGEEDNWLDSAGYRVILADACFGGRVSNQFLGDLGGLPGWVLSLGCRLFCSPIAEVPPQVVDVLHRHLIGSGPLTFGERYLAAVRESPAVGLYNLYGFADEPMMP